MDEMDMAFGQILLNTIEALFDRNHSHQSMDKSNVWEACIHA
jgi:hypothetical protein